MKQILRRLVVALSPCALALTALPAAAQTPVTVDPESGLSSACAAEAFRAFDYWLGSWIVRDGEGTEIGRNRISRISQGCAVLEEWTPAGGGPEGSSVNFLEPATGMWNQLWVGGGGLVLRLEGRPDQGVMTLEGSRTTPAGAVVRDRISWIPLPDGRVEQRWESATGGDGEWAVTFRGFYERVPGS